MLLLIDGNNLAHRCKHTFSLSNRGKDVSVVYGCLKVLGSLIEKFAPTSVMVCWDGGTPEFRRQKLPAYKANRTKGDPLEYENFIRQVRELADYVFPISGIVSVRKRGAEADDLLYHASRLHDGPSIIVTTDADLLQAVCAGVDVYSPTKAKLYDQAVIKRLYGVVPSTLPHMKALMGDSSDNIAGVRGIGEKTAIKLFQQFGSLSGIVNAALGCNPEGKLTDALGRNISNFGMDRLATNVAIISLHADRVGARMAILDATEDFHYANKTSLKKYFMRNAFVSLMGSGFIGIVGKLVKPAMVPYGLRVPVVCSYSKVPLV